MGALDLDLGVPFQQVSRILFNLSELFFSSGPFPLFSAAAHPRPMKRRKKKLISSLFLFFGSLPISLMAQDQPLDEVDVRESYILRPNDVVKLSVYEESDLDCEVKILKTGQASFRLIGPVKIGGLSVKHAADLIQERYAKDYLRNPELTLTVSEYAVEFVTVIGQVVKPGPIPIPHEDYLDVGGALASAGGITEMADPKNIQIVSASGDHQSMTYSDIQGIAGRLQLHAGDQIIVAESPYARSKVAVIGEVKVPGDVPIPNTGALDLASALATAGGIGEMADTSRIKVITPEGKTDFYTIESIRTGAAGRRPLKGGDRVIVAQSRFANTFVTVVGEVKRPGPIAFPISGKLDLLAAIGMAGGFTDSASQRRVKVTRGGKATELDVKKIRAAGQTIWLYPNDVIEIAESIF